MLSVLSVEDDTTKFGKICDLLITNGVNRESVDHAVCAADAVTLLARKRYDLMLLDINLPRVLGQEPVRGGGIEILRQIERDDTLNRPSYIIGATAYEDLVGEFGPAFQEQMWSVIHYAETSDYWRSQLVGKLNYVRAAKRSRRF